MTTSSPSEITNWLQLHKQGDPDALHQLWPLIYDELRALARRWLTSQHVSWQPTTLANELFVQLFDGEPPNWENSQHFFGTASLKLRHLLIDQARHKQTQKHGGQWQKVSLDEHWAAASTNAAALSTIDLLSLHQALEALEREDMRAAKVVELRFFAGFTEVEIAPILGISERVVRRDWKFAKSWLLQFLSTTRQL
jgi:RNA polymerase sigma-70 factor, ECF subfamily